jgi:hypothetical protein
MLVQEIMKVLNFLVILLRAANFGRFRYHWFFTSSTILHNNGDIVVGGNVAYYRWWKWICLPCQSGCNRICNRDF